MPAMNPNNGGAPIYAFGSIVVFVFALVVLVVSGHGQDSSLFIGLAITTIPSLVAALFAERGSRDIRNGVIQDKAREGASQAIIDHQVVTRQGPYVSHSLEALSQLLIAANPAARDALESTLQNVVKEESQ